MSGNPNRRRSWLIGTLALVLAVAAVYLVSRPARPTAGPEPVSASTPAPTQSPSPTGETLAPSVAASNPASATVPTSPVATAPASAAAAAPKSPVRTKPTSDADLAFVVPTPPPGRAPAARNSPPRSCLEWRGTASDQQQRSATALLRAARQGDGVAKAPSSSVVRAYRLAITTACGGTDRRDDNVADVARAAYVQDRDRWRI